MGLALQGVRVRLCRRIAAASLAELWSWGCSLDGARACPGARSIARCMNWIVRIDSRHKKTRAVGRSSVRTIPRLVSSRDAASRFYDAFRYACIVHLRRRKSREEFQKKGIASAYAAARCASGGPATLARGCGMAFREGETRGATWSPMQAVFFAFCNLCRKHETIGQTPRWRQGWPRSSACGFTTAEFSAGPHSLHRISPIWNSGECTKGRGARRVIQSSCLRFYSEVDILWGPRRRASRRAQSWP